MLETGAIDRADVAGGARDARSALHDSLRAEEPHGQYFKEQVRRSWSTASAGSASTRAGCASSRRSTCRCRSPPKRRSPQSLKALDERRGARSRRARAKKARAAADAGDAAAGGAVALDPADRPRARDGRRPRLRREPLQPRGAGAAAAGLGVQAVRLRRGARSGLHAGDGHRSPRTIRSPRCRARGRRKTSTPTRRLDEPAHRRCARRATAPPCGCCSRSASRRRCSTRRRWASATCRACRRWRSAPAR